MLGSTAMSVEEATPASQDSTSVVVISHPDEVPNSTAAQTPAAGCFTSENALRLFLSTHIKSKGSFAQIDAKISSVNDR